MTGTADKTISDQAKRERAAYYRQWRKRNPGKASEYQRRYWQRKAQQSASTEAPDGEKTVRENG